MKKEQRSGGNKCVLSLKKSQVFQRKST